MKSKRSIRHRWAHVATATRLVRCRLAENRRDFSKAQRLLEAAPARDTVYRHLMQLYRLKLMVVQDDSRRHAFAEHLRKEQWSVETDDDRYFDIYRQMMCAGLAGELDEAEQAAEALRRSPVRSFIENTLPALSPGWIKNTH